MTTYCAPCLSDLALVRESATTVSGTAACMAHAVLLSYPRDEPGRRRSRLNSLRDLAESKQAAASEEDQPNLELLVQEYSLAAVMDSTPPVGQQRPDRNAGSAADRPGKPRRQRPPRRPGEPGRPEGARHGEPAAAGGPGRPAAPSAGDQQGQGQDVVPGAAPSGAENPSGAAPSGPGGFSAPTTPVVLDASITPASGSDAPQTEPAPLSPTPVAAPAESPAAPTAPAASPATGAEPAPEH